MVELLACPDALLELRVRALRAGAVVGLECETKLCAGTSFSFTTFHWAPADISRAPPEEVSGIMWARFNGVLLPLSCGCVGTMATVLPERTNVAVTGWNLTGTLPPRNPVGVHSQPIPGWKHQPP